MFQPNRRVTSRALTVIIAGGLASAAGAVVVSCHGPDTGPPDDEVSRVSRPLTADNRNVWTHHSDNNRTGAQLYETILNPSNVNNTAFGKLFERAVDDQIYAQPLWIANVPIGGSTRNVVYVATVNGTVYAFDADDPSAGTLASRNLIPSGWTTIQNTDMTGACGGYYTDFSGKMSIVGTPVIDVAAGTMFLVVRSKSGTTFQQKLHALDITSSTLAERTGSPVVISASVSGTGDGSSGGVLPFHNQRQAQRAGLVLTGGRVYIAWASHCDWGPYHGWIMGYNASTLAQTFVWNSSPNGSMDGIWQAGQPPSVDSTGKLYFMTGNGTSDARTGGTSYGHSFVKLDPLAGSPVVSWFTPYDVDSANGADLDLGSAGPLLLPDGSNRVLGAGKNAKIYVVNATTMGGYQSGSDSQIVQSFNGIASHLHGSPVYYNAPGINKKLVYMWAEYDYLKAFEWNAGGNGMLTTTPYKTSTMRVPDGMPGGQLSVSANDGVDNTGILWATHPFSGDANHSVQPGILRAFNAKDVSVELWNSRSDMSNDYGNFAKNPAPVVANGKVYMATFSNKLVVYGLKGTNLALNKTATASSFEAAGYEASKAVDGSTTTRWSSQYSDPQWIYVDLGATYSVNRVVINWEFAYATAYQIQVSPDASAWTTVWSTTTGTGGVADISFSATSGRYVRMYGTARGTPYGYSIWEFQVYGQSVGSGTGLRGEYFDNIDLTASKVTRTDATVGFDWGSGSPDPSVGVDTFSVRWTGQVQAINTETYTFYTYTDDGVRLWVNNVLLVDKWVDQGPTEWSGSIALTAGQKYDIKMEYFENGGGAVAQLSWSSPSVAKQIIPQNRLFLPAAATEYIYLEAENGTITSPMGIVSESLASAGQHIEVAAGNNSLTSAPASGWSTLNFSAVGGTYKLWGRVITPTGNDDSFWVRMDGGSWVKWNDIPGGTSWHWDDIHNSDAGGAALQLSLGGGSHTLDIAYREDGAKLDRLLITNDLGFTPTASPPPTPTGLSANAGSGQVALSWGASSGATSYNVKRSTVNGGPYSTIATVTGTSYTNSGLTNGTTYYYVVSALNTAGGQSANSSQVSATPSSGTTAALLVVADPGALTTGDANIKSRLEGLGYTVTLADDQDANLASLASGKQLAVVAESCLSSNVGNKLDTTTVPVLALEAFVWDDMRMGTPAVANGAQTQIDIINASHNLAAALSGTVTLATAASNWQYATGLGGGAQNVGSIVAQPTQITLLGYESGAALTSGTAPARRVGYAFSDQAALNANDTAWMLFDAAAAWAAGNTTGLKGEYFDNTDFTSLKVTRTDQRVPFDWGTGSPDPTVGVDTFSVRWTGDVVPTATETFTFYTYTDDGVRLWVNNVLLVDKWVDQGPTEWSGTISLTKGQKVSIKVEYFENGGGAVAQVSWSSASEPKKIIPGARLRRAP